MKKVLKLFVVLTFCILVVGCSLKKQEEIVKEEEKVLSKEDLKKAEIEKLKQALINDGYVEIEKDAFKKTVTEKYNEDGTQYHINFYYFYIDNLNYSQLVHMDVLSTSQYKKVSLGTNTAEGYTIFFDEVDRRKWEDKWDYYYDFNSGIGNCTSFLGYTCSSHTDLMSFKNSILSFFSENNIDIELLK